MQRADISAAQGILRQLCPRCRTGRIFRRSIWLFPPMYECCPACSLKFEREEGYFLGAMYISYGLGLGTIAILAALVWETSKWPLVKSVIGGTVLFLPFAPVLTWMAASCGSRWIRRLIPTARSLKSRIYPSNALLRDLHADARWLLYNPP